jgi:hypothetical protein
MTARANSDQEFGWRQYLEYFHEVSPYCEQLRSASQCDVRLFVSYA